jgi:hypothetical protein
LIKKLKLNELLEIEKRLNKFSFLDVPLGGLLINNFYMQLYFFGNKHNLKSRLINLLIFLKLRFLSKGKQVSNWQLVNNNIILNPSSTVAKNLDFFIPLIEFTGEKKSKFVFCFKPNTVIEIDDINVFNNYQLSNADRLFWENGMIISYASFKMELKSIFKDYCIPKQYFQLFLNDFLYQTQILTFFLERFKLYKPKAIITDHDRYSFNSALILAGNYFKIPTYTFVHGSTFPPDHFYPVLAQKMFVWGRVHYNQFKNLGVSEEKIVIIGNQKLNRNIIDLSLQKKIELGLLDKKVILLANSNFQIDERLGLTKIFCESSLTFPEYDFWVRLHPVEKISEYDVLLKQYPKIRFFDNNHFTSEQSFAIASIIIGHSSTYLFDAFVKGKNLIILNPDFVNFPLGIGSELNRYGNVPIAKNSSELNQLIGKVNSDLKNKSELELMIENFCSYFEYDSLNKILDEINLIKSS